jgi:hypothetical protein
LLLLAAPWPAARQLGVRAGCFSIATEGMLLSLQLFSDAESEHWNHLMYRCEGTKLFDGNTRQLVAERLTAHLAQTTGPVQTARRYYLLQWWVTALMLVMSVQSHSVTWAVAPGVLFLASNVAWVFFIRTYLQLSASQRFPHSAFFLACATWQSAVGFLILLAWGCCLLIFWPEFRVVSSLVFITSFLQIMTIALATVGLVSSV